MATTPLLDRLDAATRTALLEAGSPLVVEAGETLTHYQASGGSVFLVLDGLLKIVKPSRSGKVAFLSLCRPGGLVGELSMLTDTPRSSSVQAVQPSTVAEIDRERFAQLLDDHDDLGRELLALIADRVRDATTLIHAQTNADAVTRVASRLLQLVEPAIDGEAESVELELPISQEELGDWAGLSRAGVVKALRSLRSDGFVETSRMSISILDLPGLRAAALV